MRVIGGLFEGLLFLLAFFLSYDMDEREREREREREVDGLVPGKEEDCGTCLPMKKEENGVLKSHIESTQAWRIGVLMKKKLRKG